MAREKPLLDNLRYIFCKDASNGKQAGFNVQAVRDRLTEIQYDLDHIQGDIDQIINGDLSSIYEDVKNIYEKIESLKQQFNEFKVQIKQELDNFKVEIRNELAAEVNKIEQKITQINGRLDNLDAELAEVKRTYEHFPTGTKLLFYQKSAPPGWSVVQGLDDAILQVSTVKGGELVTGASFEQVFTSNKSSKATSITITGSCSPTALTVSQMPAHSHSRGTQNITGEIPEGTEEAGENSPYLPKGAFYWTGETVDTGPDGGRRSYSVGFDASRTWTGHSSVEGGGHPHSHTLNITGNSTSHTHSIDLTIKNISVIVCQKEVVF